MLLCLHSNEASHPTEEELCVDENLYIFLFVCLFWKPILKNSNAYYAVNFWKLWE